MQRYAERDVLVPGLAGDPNYPVIAFHKGAPMTEDEYKTHFGGETKVRTADGPSRAKRSPSDG